MDHDNLQEDSYGEDISPNFYANREQPQSHNDGNGVDNLTNAVNKTATNPILQPEYTDDDDEEEAFMHSIIPSIVLKGVNIQRPHSGGIDHEDDNEEDYSSYRKKRMKMNKKKRVIKKGGLTNVTYKNISKKRRRYISDLYTTLLDSPWHWCIFIFVVGFYGSWILFGGLYYMICFLHGDLEISRPKDWKPCIQNVDSFAASFLFSLETQHTIGYGGRMTTTECPDAMLVMSIQSVLGCLIQAFMVGLVFTKLSHPRYRCKTIIFSNKAVICQRDRRLCLIIRIGDLRDDNFILGTQLSAKLLRRRTTQEGEIYQEMHYLDVNPDTSNQSCIFFVWPLDIVHVIDEASPFYGVSAHDLAKERFELLLIMEGTNETSNTTFQARTSYLPNEILWGQRFESMTIYRKDNNKFQVNFSAFHSTYEVDTPLCSARDLEQFYESYCRKVSSSPRDLTPHNLSSSFCGHDIPGRQINESVSQEINHLNPSSCNNSNKRSRLQAREKKKQIMSNALLSPGKPTNSSISEETNSTATFPLGKHDDESDTSDTFPNI